MPSLALLVAREHILQRHARVVQLGTARTAGLRRASPIRTAQLHFVPRSVTKRVPRQLHLSQFAPRPRGFASENRISAAISVSTAIGCTPLYFRAVK